MKTATPKNAEEMREQLTDKRYMRELLTDPEKFADYVEDAVNYRVENDPGIAAQQKQQTEAFMIEFLKGVENEETRRVAERLNLGGPTSRVRPNTIYNAKALGAPHDKLFEDTTDLLYAISDQSLTDGPTAKKLDTLRNALSSMKPSEGGFLIPEVLRAEVLRVALERAVVRSRARVIPMDSLTVPFPKLNSTSNVSSIYGGVIGFWTEEGATLTASNPEFGRVELRAQKLTLYTEVPNELLMDSRPSMAAFINDIFPEAVAWFEDVAFFIGGGVGEPLGFLNAPAKVSVTRDASGAAVEWIDIVSMYCRMLPQSLDRAVWVISPDTLPSLLQLTTETGVSVVWLGGGSFGTAAASPPMTMLGLPIIISEKARAVGTAGDINLVDFGFYLIGDRQAMSAKQSDDFKFDRDVTAFRVTERLDGRPWLDAPITPQNGGATLSPFVQLL
jgi:HK97 family phage major capsid protein